MKLALFLAASALCLGQSPAFEVVSVKINTSNSGRSNSPRLYKGTLAAENIPMRSILEAAYGLSSLQITGPAWIDNDRYDLSGKSPAGVPDTELMPMLQALLKSRFQLTAHKETKELPVYDLVIAKGGLKIFPASDPNHPQSTPPRIGRSSMTIGQFTMTELAKIITGAAGRPVIDRTGLDGKYFLVLQYVSMSEAGDNTVDIFAALEQQAGLKLEPKKEPIETLVVDRAERVPTEN